MFKNTFLFCMVVYAAILFSKIACLVVYSNDTSFNKINLVKRQVLSSPASSSASSNYPHVAQEPTSSLSETDRNALKAAEMYLNNDHISFQQALNKHMKTDNSHASQSDPKPFTDDVLRRNKRKRPVGYDTVKQVAVRHAERFLKNNKITTEEANKFGKMKVAQKNNGRRERIARWKLMAETDPSLVRFEESNVSKRISKHQYIPLRAHQLNYQGKAKDLQSAAEIAKGEIEETLAKNKEKYRIRKAKDKQQKQG